MGKMKRPKNKKKEYIDKSNLVYYSEFTYDEDDNDDTKINVDRAPACAHDVEVFFNEVYKKKNNMKEEDVSYDVYRFVRMVKCSRVDLLFTTATRLSELPDIFKSKKYIKALLPQYMAFALNIHLSHFKICRHIPVDMRTEMLKEIINNYMYTDYDTYHLLLANIKYLLRGYTYYANKSDEELLDFDLLFSDTEQLRLFLNAIVDIYDKKRAFEIIYMVYHDYVNFDDDLTETMMITIPKYFVRRLILPWYPIYKFITHPMKFLQKEI